MRRLGWLLILVIAALVAPAAAAAARSTPISDTDRELYALVEVTKPEPLPADELRHVQDLRETFGLRHDADFVRRLHAHPGQFDAVRSDRGFWGSLLVTPEELPRLRTRSGMEAGALAYGGAIRDVLGGSDAGTFVAGNRYVVQCARCDVDGIRAELARLDLPSLFGDRIVVRSVRYSQSELTDFQQKIGELLRDAGVTSAGTGTSPIENRIVIDVGPRGKREAQRALEGSVPARAYRFHVYADPTVRPNGSHRRYGSATWFDAARTDGRRGIVVSFTGAAPVTDPRNACQFDYRAFAVEHHDAVEITVRSIYRAAHREPVACTLEGYRRTARVVLRRPLGQRRLVDGANGNPIPVFDGSTLLEPTWLPPGWKAASEGGMNTEAVGSTWSRTFGAPGARDANSCNDASASVWLAQGPAPRSDLPLFDPATVVDVVEVRGQSATRTYEPRSGTTSVRWIEPAGAVVLDGYRGCVGASGVDLDTLTRIAQGLR